MKKIALAVFVIQVLGSTLLWAQQDGVPVPVETVASPTNEAIPTNLHPEFVPTPVMPVLPEASSANSIQELQAQRLQEMEYHWRDRLDSQQRQMVMLVVLLLLVAPVSFAFGVAHARYRHQLDFHHKLRQLIEKGTPIPAELLAPPTGKPPISDLRKGVLLIVSGVGLMLFLGVLLQPGGWSLGLIPILIGLTYLVLRRIERKEVE